MVGIKSIYTLKFLEKNLNFLLRALVYSSGFYFFSLITADTDLWGHIKFGEDLCASKTLHRFDIYSYTAYGNVWINHEWLSELLMYLAYNMFGTPGLLFGKLRVHVVSANLCHGHGKFLPWPWQPLRH